MNKKDLSKLATPISDHDGDYLTVVVIDVFGQSRTEYNVAVADPLQIANAALMEHDTATDVPEGVTAYVFEPGVEDPIAMASS